MEHRSSPVCRLRFVGAKSSVARIPKNGLVRRRLRNCLGPNLEDTRFALFRDNNAMVFCLLHKVTPGSRYPNGG